MRRLLTQPLTLVLLGGLVLRVALLVAVRDVTTLVGDERDYVQLASSIDAGRGFAYPNGRPTSMRPPIYPAFVAALSLPSSKPSLQAVRGAQIVLSLLSVVVVFMLARLLFDGRVAIWAAAGWCFYPSFLFAGVVILTEVLFTLLLLTGCLCAVIAVQRPMRAWPWGLAAGVAIGLAALTRSVVWPLPIVLVPLLIVLIRPFAKRALTVGLATTVGYALVVGPWAVRNTILQKTPVIVDAMGGLNLRMGNYEYTLEDRMWDGVSLSGDKAWSFAMVAEHPDATYWTEGQRDRWASRQAIQYMLANPATTLRRSALKFADFWGLEREYVAGLRSGRYRPPTWFAAGSSAAVIATYVGTMLLAVLGLFATRKNDWRLHVVPVLLVAWICGIHTVVFGHSRYHLPLMPILIIYAAAAVSANAWQLWLLTRWRAMASVASIAVLSGIWVREVLFRDPERIRQLLAVAGL